VALVVGLGNPGRRYADTRHNAGWRVVEVLVRRWSAVAGEPDPTYRSWRAVVRGRLVDLMTPLTYMNLSGEALVAWRGRNGFDPVTTLVVCDDVYLPVGVLRLRAGGSSGGHRGLESLAAVAGGDLGRLRVGVGGTDAERLREHVLEAPSADEQETYEEAIARAADAVECWVSEGLVAAMNRFNRKIGKEDQTT
jgi:PTH1 family peptidyl-tRNA hydrolase